MLNLSDKSDKFDWISRTHIIVIFMIFILGKPDFYKLSEMFTLNNVYYKVYLTVMYQVELARDVWRAKVSSGYSAHISSSISEAISDE